MATNLPAPYAEPLVHYLANKPVEIVQVNTMHTKKMKEVNDNSPLKTDDEGSPGHRGYHPARTGLDHCCPRGRCRLSAEAEQCAGTARGRAAALLNQLEQLVFLIFPEFKTVLKNMKGKTAHYILKRYTLPERIGTLSKEALGEEMRNGAWGSSVSRMRVSDRSGARDG